MAVLEHRAVAVAAECVVAGQGVAGLEEVPDLAVAGSSEGSFPVEDRNVLHLVDVLDVLFLQNPPAISSLESLHRVSYAWRFLPQQHPYIHKIQILLLYLNRDRTPS